MQLHPGRTRDVTAAQASDRLGLDSSHASWLAKLARVEPTSHLPVPRKDALAALLRRLDVDPVDAAEVLRTLPSPDPDPELWWLLERSHQALAHGLAHRDTHPE